jgi:hypothetical protein
MATVAYTAWLPEVMPDAPDCPEVVALNAIRNAAIEFCNETLYWQADIGAVALTDALLPYTIAPPASTVVAQVMVASLLGRPLAVTNIQELDNRVVNWREAEGQPRAVFQPDPGVLDLYPRPAGTDSYDVFIRVALAPTRASTTVDDRLHIGYLEDIAAGALSRLLAMPNRPWSNTEGARYYGSTFASAKVEAAIEATKSFGRGELMVQMRTIPT